MPQSLVYSISISEIISVISKELLQPTHVVEVVWETLSKMIIGVVKTQKSLLVFDTFYISESEPRRNCPNYQWTLTRNFQQECAIECREEQKIGFTTTLTLHTFTKYLETQENGQPYREDLMFRILFKIIENIRELIKENELLEIDLQYFGFLIKKGLIIEHHYKSEDRDSINVKKLVTPKSRKISLFRVSKRESRKNSDALSLTNKKQFKKNPRFPFQQDSENDRKKTGNQNKENSWLNRYVTPDIKIPSDLLGAGLDPLKYEYTFSKLVDKPKKLLNKTFIKPDFAKHRHPGVIDKFERTGGAPQTGLKISNSIVVRIGSNYNDNAKKLYNDIEKKCIMLVPYEGKISLVPQEYRKQRSATEDQEYTYVMTGDPSLYDKVQQRKRTYDRYLKYKIKYIENSNVSPLPRDKIQRIIKAASSFLSSEQFKSYYSLIENVLNQINQDYYLSYKKSILDYILKDEGQKKRIDIDTVFRECHEWGVQLPNQKKYKTTQIMQKYTREQIIQNLQKKFVQYPKCVLEITTLNKKVEEIDYFKIKGTQSKPVNVLYFIKKQNTHIAEITSYLSTTWVKNVVEIMRRFINFDHDGEKKIKAFLKLINVMMSNTLKSIVLKSFQKINEFFRKFEFSSTVDCPPLLQISIIDDGTTFGFSDNFRKIMVDQIEKCFQAIVQDSKKIPTTEFYLKDEANSFLWSIDQEDMVYKQSLKNILQVIRENCDKIDRIRENFDKFQEVLKFKDRILQWLKCQRQYKQIKQCLEKVEKYEEMIEAIPFYYKCKMVVVECFEERKKLSSYLINLKSLMYQNLQNSLKKNNMKIQTSIDEIRRKISSPIENTSDYLSVSTDIECIKKNQLRLIRDSMQKNKTILLNLQNMGYGYVTTELIDKIYQTYLLEKSLNMKIIYHEQRISKEKVLLENELRGKISQFESTTTSQLKNISSRIDEFELRRLYNEYLNQLKQFKEMVQNNHKKIIEFNKQEEDLRWTKNNFPYAEELKGIVEPNYDLWSLISEYDSLMKQWRNMELCMMDVKEVKKKITTIDEKINKSIKKLKNLSSLKIAYELQNDTKQILQQQIRIIEIFSHPGLKERHWQLFNSKLMIPGIDLKEITFSKIKIFYDYEKNLKVLSIISNQAMRQFELESQKSEQQDYWNAVSFATYTNPFDNSSCINEKFFIDSINKLQQHCNRLIVMKNTLYSKALYQQLIQWEQWLHTTYKVMTNLNKIQKELHLIKPLFTLDQINKQLAVEFSEFEAVESCWKSIIKKIWEYPLLNQFVKSPRLNDLIEEINKKIETIMQGILTYLKIKRLQFPRFFFIPDDKLLNILSHSAYGSLEKKAIQTAFHACFPTSLTLKQNDDKYLQINSFLDSLSIDCDVFSVKVKKKISENMNLLQKCIGSSLRKQISTLLNYDIFEDVEKFLQGYCFPAIHCAQSIHFTQQLQDSIENHTTDELANKKLGLIHRLRLYRSELSFGKIDKLLTLVLWEYEKAKEMRDKGVESTSDWDYLVEIRYTMNHQEGEFDTNIKPHKKKEGKGRLSKAYEKITSMRRYSAIRLEKTSSIQLEILNHKHRYGEQYWGDELVSFLPSFTTYPTAKMFHNLSQYYINTIFHQETEMLTYGLATICGRYYKKVEERNVNPNYFNSIVEGVICSGGWICIGCELSEKEVKLLGSVMEEIKERKTEIIFEKEESKSTAPTYLNSLSCLLEINLEGACFLSIKDTNYKQIPENIKLCMRTLSVTLPQFCSFSYSFSPQLQLQQISKLKTLIEIAWPFQNYPAVGKKSCNLQTITKLMLDIKKQENIQIIDNILCKLHQGEKKDVHRLYEEHIPFSLLKEEEEWEEGFEYFQKTHGSYSMIRFMEEKKEELLAQLNISDRILLVGNCDDKCEIVKGAMSELKYFGKISPQKYMFPLSILKADPYFYLNLILEELLYEYINHYKPRKHSVKTLYLYFQYEQKLEDQTLEKINSTLREIIYEGPIFSSFKQENSTNMEQLLKVVLIFQTVSLECLSPMVLTSVGKVIANISDRIHLPSIYRKWCSELQIFKEGDSMLGQTALVDQILSYEEKLFSLLQSTLKPYRNHQNKHFTPMKIKLFLLNNFLKMYSMYLENLSNKDLDDGDDFDCRAFVQSSFIYCAYWVLCMGYLQPYDHCLIEESINNLFPTFDEVNRVGDYLLNQDNEWLKWSAIKEDFGVLENKTTPIYEVWVSTDDNMKLYTNVIKFLEKNISLLIIGKHCSGKSELLKEIVNFQMTYTSFMIDCHKHSQSISIGSCIKNKIVFGKIDKSLILIDDVDLPMEETSITIMIKKILNEHLLACQLKPNKFEKIIHSLPKSAMMLTLTDEKSISYNMLRSNIQGIKINSLSEQQLTTIFNYYLESELNRLDCLDMMKSTIQLSISYLMKLSFRCTLNTHKVFKIIELFITKLQHKFKSPDHESVKKVIEGGEKLKLEFVECLNFIIALALQNPAAQKHFEKYSNEEMNKVMPAKFMKSMGNFGSYCWKQLTSEVLDYFPMLEQKYSQEQVVSPEVIENAIEGFATQREEIQFFVCTKFHTELIMKLIIMLQVMPSHIIFLTDGLSSSKTICKLASFVAGINFLEIDHNNTDIFLKESLNIIKVGGKVDESTYYLPKGTALINNIPSEVLKIMNSYISSIELYEYFTEDQVEQIFIKFSSEKKALKRTEFIRKIREKINLLFHIVICMSGQEFDLIRTSFPMMVEKSQIVRINKWPDQSYHTVGKRTLNSSKTVLVSENKQLIFTILDEVHKLFTQQYYEKKTIRGLTYKCHRIYELYQTFLLLINRITTIQNSDELQIEVWENKIRENEIKLQRLRQDKEIITKENQEYFKHSNKKKFQLQETKRKLQFKENAKENVEGEIRAILETVNKIKKQANNFSDWVEYREVLKIEEELVVQSSEEFNAFLKLSKWSKIIRLMQSYTEHLFEEDAKYSVMESLQKMREIELGQTDDTAEQIISVSRSIEKSSVVGSLVIDWLTRFEEILNKMKALEIEVEKEEGKRIDLIHKRQTLKSQYMELKNGLGDLSKEAEQTINQDMRMEKKYEEINQTILQVESIINILKHFESLIKSKKKRSPKVLLPQYDIVGNFIFYACLVQFSFYFTYNPLEEFIQDIYEILHRNKCSFNRDLRYLSELVRKDDQVKYKYLYPQVVESTLLNHIMIGITVCSVFIVEKREDIFQMLEWLDVIFMQKKQIVENDELRLVRNCISNGQICVVVQPSKDFIEKVKPLIESDGEFKNNTVFVHLEEETILNPKSRVFFVYYTDDIQQGLFHPLLRKSLYCLKFKHNNPFPESKIIKKKIQQILKQKNIKQELIKQYMQYSNELLLIDDKIESIIHAIRKQIDNPDNIILKIESISKQKNKLEQQMERTMQKLKSSEKAEQEQTIEGFEIISEAAIQLSQSIFNKKQQIESLSIFNLKKLLELAKKVYGSSSLQKIVDKFKTFMNLLNKPSKPITYSVQLQNKQAEIAEMTDLLCAILNINEEDSLKKSLKKKQSQTSIIFQTHLTKLANKQINRLFEEIDVEVESINLQEIFKNPLKYSSFHDKVVLLCAENDESWKRIHTLRQEFEQKNLNIKLVILCDYLTKIPHKVEQKTIIIANPFEIQYQVHDIIKMNYLFAEDSTISIEDIHSIDSEKDHPLRWLKNAELCNYVACSHNLSNKDKVKALNLLSE